MDKNNAIAVLITAKNLWDTFDDFQQALGSLGFGVIESDLYSATLDMIEETIKTVGINPIDNETDYNVLTSYIYNDTDLALSDFLDKYCK
jgi:hypothetical protein